MDLQELSALTSRCPDSRTFFERLVQRWLQVKIKGTSYMRTKVLVDLKDVAAAEEMSREQPDAG